TVGRVLGLAVLIFLFTLAALSAGWLDFPEVRFIDHCLRLRGRLPSPSDVVIVALDERTMAQAPYFSPVPRELLAKLIRRLSDRGVKTIALDVALPDQRNAKEDADLQNALLDAGNVVLPVVVNAQGNEIRPAPYFEDVAVAVGDANVEITEADHRVR